MHRPLQVCAAFLVAVIASHSAVATPPNSAPTAQPASTPASPATTASPAPQDISELLVPILREHPVPALAAACIEGDHIIMEGVTGVRAMGSPEKATLDDQWHLGSCTKAMTATLAAMLVQDGSLTWDTTPVEVFPTLAANADPSWKLATLARLITNRAGAPGDLSPRNLWSKLWNSNETPAQLRRMLLADILPHETDFPPGSKFKYSNTNFAIAGAMEEQRAGTPWEELIHERLFAPLGITSSGYGAPGLTGVVSQPRGHTAESMVVEPTHDGDNPQAIAPAGTVHMSIRDWAKFVALHLQGDPANPERVCRLLTPESFIFLHTAPDGADYAGGWGITHRDWGGGEGEWKGRVLTHSGSNTSWFCVAWIAPSRNFAVLACTNIAGEHGPKAADAAVWALIQKHLKL